MADSIAEGLDIPKKLPQIDNSTAWKIYVDGAKNNLGAGISIVLKSFEGAVFEHYLRLNCPTTNNEAAYEDLITNWWFSNSTYSATQSWWSNQVTSKFEAQDAKMAKYLAIAKTFLT